MCYGLFPPLAFGCATGRIVADGACAAIRPVARPNSTDFARARVVPPLLTCPPCAQSPRQAEQKRAARSALREAMQDLHDSSNPDNPDTVDADLLSDAVWERLRRFQTDFVSRHCSHDGAHYYFDYTKSDDA